MIQLTFWEDPKIKRTEDDFDSILTVHLKSVKQIPELVAHMPKRCTMISTERSAAVKRKGRIINPGNPKYFKEIWRKGQPIPAATSKKCPLCGA
jgi:hypothetical protein